MRQRLKTGEALDLCAEFRDRPGGRSSIQDLLLERLRFLGRNLVVIGLLQLLDLRLADGVEFRDCPAAPVRPP